MMSYQRYNILSICSLVLELSEYHYLYALSYSVIWYVMPLKVKKISHMLTPLSQEGGLLHLQNVYSDEIHEIRWLRQKILQVMLLLIRQ